jgi:hypothetical protein
MGEGLTDRRALWTLGFPSLHWHWH